MLHPGHVGVAVRRQASEGPAPGIALPELTAPGLQRKRRVGDHHIKGAQATGGGIGEHGVSQGVAPLDHEVLQSMEEEVHSRHGGGGEVFLLAENLAKEGARVPSTSMNMLNGSQQHAAGATGWVVDRFPLLRIHDVHHQADNAARGVELAGFLVRGVGELLDEVLVGVTHHVGGDRCVADRQRGEVFNQILEELIRQAILIGPLGVAKDAIKVLLVGSLHSTHGVRECCADVLGSSAHIVPVGALRKLKAVLVVKILAVLSDHGVVLFMPLVADPLEKQQWQDVRLPITAINRAAAEDVGGFPEMGYQLGEGQRPARADRSGSRSCS